jgi:hypothetical protein
MSGLFTPSAEPEHYVLGHFRPNIFGGRIFGASLIQTESCEHNHPLRFKMNKIPGLLLDFIPPGQFVQQGHKSAAEL